MPENSNIIWAGVFLDELARAGVSVICVAPGSRSTPLVLAGAEDPRFRLVSIVDERSAGFFALGVGAASGIPAAVVTTSGTAGANLYPSVVEAAQGEVPLLVLTADRPHRLRDTDGNQAMDQLRLFGSFPRAFFDIAPVRMGDRDLKHLRGQACRAVSLAQGPPPGPVHLNFPFEKPLEPHAPAGDGDAPSEDLGATPGDLVVPPIPSPLALDGRTDGAPFTRVLVGSPRLSETESDHLFTSVRAADRGLIVIGPQTDGGQAASAVLSLGKATGFPVLADPLSGARFGPDQGAQVVAGYDIFLRSEAVRATLRPELIIRVGASPTSAALLDFLKCHEDVPQVVVDHGHRWKDHTLTGHTYVRAGPGPLLELLAAKAHQAGEVDGGGDRGRGWRTVWSEVQEETLRVLNAQSRVEVLEGWILEAVAELLPAGSQLLVSSSMPIRDLDAFGRPRPEPLQVFGNRGASGIDGLVSTTLGIGSSTDGRTVGVLGDLAFFHDMNGLLTLKQQKLPVGFVVVNNDGGGIFHTLPVEAFEPAFTEFFATPHGLDFSKVAELYGLEFSRTNTTAGFRKAFPRLLSQGGAFLLEVVTDREKGHPRRKEVFRAVADAVENLHGGAALPKDTEPGRD